MPRYPAHRGHNGNQCLSIGMGGGMSDVCGSLAPRAESYSPTSYGSLTRFSRMAARFHLNGLAIAQ
eukprot:3614323-Karenia_brevis.AAC.1